VARAVKQTTEALIREVESLQTQISNLQSAVGVASPGDQATILVGGGNGGMSLPGNDAALDAIFTRAVEQSQIYIRQARTEAQSALSALRVALDNFENGYADTNAVVNATIDSLVSRVGENEASIFNEQLTRTTATQALAGRISQITSVVNGNSASITTEQVTRADADEALAGQIQTVAATAGSNTAAITQEAIARANADEAIGLLVEEVTATANTNTARITTEELARADADEALTLDITRVEAKTDAGTANGFYRLTALSSPTDGAAAEFAVEVKASSGGAYSSAGMSIQAFSSGENRIKMRTDRFIVADSANTFSPFQIITGLSQTTFAATNVTAALWTGTQYVLGGSNGGIGTSTNGDQWTYQGGLLTAGWPTIRSVNALAMNSTTIVAVGAAGTAAYSTDGGITWTYPTTGGTRLSGTTFGTADAMAIVWTGTQFVVVGGSGRVATSPDGIAWTYRGGLVTVWGSTRTARALAWSGSTLLVTGDDGYAATSLDGITWTNQPGLAATLWGNATETRAALWYSSKFVVVGDAGKVATATYNSTTLAWEWTYQPGLAALTTTWGTANALVLVVQGTQLLTAGTAGHVATSPDGVTWTYQPSLRTSTWGTSNSVLAAASNGTITLVAGNIGATAYSQNATLWTNNAGKLGVDAVVNAGSVIGQQLEELGLLSYYNQITAQNAVTLIGSAAIGTAFIADAAITNAKIKDATITSAKITDLTADKVTAGTLQGISLQIADSAGNWIIQANYGGGDGVDLWKPFLRHGGGTNLYNPSVPGFIAYALANEGLSGVATGSSADNHGVRGQNQTVGTSGLIGVANGFDFYADGVGTANYGPFTGAHDVVANLDEVFEIGDLVVDVECILRNGISNTLFRVQKSTSAEQRGVVGVIAVVRGLLADSYPPAVFNQTLTYPAPIPNPDGGAPIIPPAIPADNAFTPIWNAAKTQYNYMAINALGEGQLNVCGEGGDISVGDLICASSIPGKGMKQADDLVHSYTVARAREAATFSSSTEIKVVPCIYLCG
jgi:hypothetical protein